jgi:hypothetical protein
LSARLTADPRGLKRFSNKDDFMPDLDENRKRRNWLVLVVLGALAALLYVAVVLKFAGYRF